ncbi:MAG: glycosyltransferase family 4 protein, partial [Pyrinomonadaceae bacterium]|nr:glycosyltransferase family 4 protein [Pyrinomonadaceae bacterium]
FDNVSRSLFNRLRAARLDVLIQDELAHPSLFLLNKRLKRHVKYSIVTLVHLLRSSEAHPALLKQLYGAIEKRYLKSVDGTIYNCETTRTSVERLLGKQLPFVVAHPGRDHLRSGLSLEEITERAKQTDPLRIISIANVVPNKGLSVLIEALAKLPADSWRLKVLGSLTMDSDYVGAIRKQITQAGLSEHVSLLGTVPNEEMPAHLAASHLLVVPSYYEAFAIVYLEAMSFGLPVIASTAGGARELITHGQEGFLLSPGDAETLALHLQQLSKERERLLQMSTAARRRVDLHPTWAESFGRIREFLQSVVNADEAADERAMQNFMGGETRAPL